MYFHSATKPLSIIVRESGSFTPAKLGLGHVDCISNLFSLAAIVKSNCCDPFNENLIEQLCSLDASSNVKGRFATKASFKVVNPPGCGLKIILLLSHFTYTSSLTPLTLSCTAKTSTASFHTIASAGILSCCHFKGLNFTSIAISLL